MKLIKLVMLVASLLMVSRSGFADSILVGTDLTDLTAGAGLCYNVSDCEDLRQQFTLTSSVVIDQIKIVMDQYLIVGVGYPGGDFTVSFTSPNGNFLGSGSVSPNLSIVPQEFDFAAADILVNPGTYYLEVTGGNVAWAHAPALLTSAGAMGLAQSCDPTFGGCRWGSSRGTFAMEIDGNVVTPEPSSWLLFGTGLLGLRGIARRRWLKLSV